MNINLQQGDCLELLKTLEDNSIDLIFTDPPYALGSEVVILPNGKPEYKKAVDFMSKWEQPNGVFWEEWFAEAKRVLKHGGHCLMFGMDRQLWFNCYYANLSGFTQKQSLYWYFISNFPKASDLSKNIDKNNGRSQDDYKPFGEYIKEKRELKNYSKDDLDKLMGTNTVVAWWEGRNYLGSFIVQLPSKKLYLKLKTLLDLDNRFNDLIEKAEAEREVVGKQNTNITAYQKIGQKNESGEIDITIASTPLAKKYEGIKYSVAPLKQTNETIMVFQKPYKTGSCLHDVLAMENGDDTITCGGVDIEGNRCGVEEVKLHFYKSEDMMGAMKNNPVKNKPEYTTPNTGRFPAQTYIDSEASAVIDLQSGVLHGAGNKKKVEGGIDSGMFGNGIKRPSRVDGFVDMKGGGASRILHKCDYELEDYDLYHYQAKVSKAERNEGLEGFEEKSGFSKNTSKIIRSVGANGQVYEKEYSTINLSKNNHPTVKPKALLSKILKLFKTPNDQVLLDPFMGSGSMGISAIETGFDYIGYELDPEYFKIAEARIENAQSKLENQLFYLC